MTERRLRKLKRKYQRISCLSLLLVMLILSAVIFGGNLFLTRQQAKNTLTYIAQNDGELPEKEMNFSIRRIGNADWLDELADAIDPKRKNSLADELAQLFGVEIYFDSPDFYYSTRYFSVITDADGEVSDVILNHIASVDWESAVEYANYAISRRARFSRFDDFFYLVEPREDGGNIVVCLDCSEQIAMERRLLSIVLLLILFGMILAMILSNFLSGRMLQREAENAALQKEFITNASHELKTPLAVIRANTELMEMTGGETEWTRSNLKQIDRMGGLIQNLVQISKADELYESERTPMDLVPIIQETTESFQPLASRENKKLSCSMPRELILTAEEGQIRQLTSILVDNAVKYCDDYGEVCVALSKKGRSARLSVDNSYADGKNTDMDRFFDRFYREDASHSEEKAGYGIGLSVAEKICQSYGGKIQVTWNEGRICFTCTLYS